MQYTFDLGNTYVSYVFVCFCVCYTDTVVDLPANYMV